MSIRLEVVHFELEFTQLGSTFRMEKVIDRPNMTCHAIALCACLKGKYIRMKEVYRLWHVFR
jgi:hypothetical protein